MAARALKTAPPAPTRSTRSTAAKNTAQLEKPKDTALDQDQSPKPTEALGKGWIAANQLSAGCSQGLYSLKALDFSAELPLAQRRTFRLARLPWRDSNVGPSVLAHKENWFKGTRLPATQTFAAAKASPPRHLLQLDLTALTFWDKISLCKN